MDRRLISNEDLNLGVSEDDILMNLSSSVMDDITDDTTEAQDEAEAQDYSEAVDVEEFEEITNATTATTSAVAAEETTSDSAINPLVIAGIGGSIILAITILATIVVLMIKRKSKNKGKAAKGNKKKKNKPSSPTSAGISQNDLPMSSAGQMAPLQSSNMGRNTVNIISNVGRTIEISSGVTSEIKVANVYNIGKRESQQDSFSMSSLDASDRYGFLAVVADGMGGLEAGGEASNIVSNHMITVFREKVLNAQNAYYDPRDLFLEMLQGANAGVVKMLREQNIALGGTTLVSVIIKDSLMDLISVGDSRIVLLRSNTLTVLNREHTYAVELDELALRGEISYEEAKNNHERKALTSYVGMDSIKHIDRTTKSIQLMGGDKIVLMSDGVFGSVSDDEIISALNQELYAGAVRLEKIILDKGYSSQDNFTAIIIEIGE